MLCFLVFCVSFQTSGEDPLGLKRFERLLYQLFTKKSTYWMYFGIVIMSKSLYDMVE